MSEIPTFRFSAVSRFDGYKDCGSLHGVRVFGYFTDSQAGKGVKAGDRIKVVDGSGLIEIEDEVAKIDPLPDDWAYLYLKNTEGNQLTP